MSAIVAIYTTFACEPAEIVQGLLNDMPYRSPDGRTLWHSGGIALGLGYMRTLPEDALHPTVYIGDEVTLVADVRLDNRPALITELCLGAADVPDGEIVLAAYGQWGTDCASHLLGDFAFIVYDGINKHVFAARDHMGIKPLFYRYDEAGLAIASEFKVLVAPGGPFNDLNNIGPLDSQIADFIANRPTESDTVVYAGLHRLPGGHTLTYRPGSAPVICRYWLPAPGSNAYGGKPGEILRELLEEAVRCRMRSASPVGGLLSGGLDSTSIACLAADINKRAGRPPFPTLSVVFDSAGQRNERPFIEDALDGRHMAPLFLDLDGYAPLEDMPSLLATQGRLISAPGLRMNALIAESLAKAGVRVFLDGHGGDEAISHGFGRLEELAVRGKWIKLWTELRAWSELYGASRLYGFILYFLRYCRFKGVYTLRRLIVALQKNDVRLTPESYLGKRLASFITPKQAASNLKGKVGSVGVEASQHATILRSTTQISSLEILEMSAASAGTEVRFPFFDKRVIEFCLGLPSEAKLDGGWIRLVLRQAMEGLLPASVQWRRSKFDFTPHLAMGLISHHTQLIQTVLDGADSNLGDYVNLDAVKADFKDVQRMGFLAKGVKMQSVWRTVILSMWLQQQRARNKSL